MPPETRALCEFEVFLAVFGHADKDLNFFSIDTNQEAVKFSDVLFSILQIAFIIILLFHRVFCRGNIFFLGLFFFDEKTPNCRFANTHGIVSNEYSDEEPV